MEGNSVAPTDQKQATAGQRLTYDRAYDTPHVIH